MLAYKKKFNLQDMASVVLAPRNPGKIPSPLTDKSIQKKFVGPFLLQLRGEKTLMEVQKILELKTWGSYHHWEAGIRDIPFAKFLQAIDKLSMRLHSFCESIQFKQDLRMFGLGGVRPDC